MKNVLYKFLTIGRGCFKGFMFKNDAKAFIKRIDFRKCQE